jgi:hypothetical protein
MKIIQSFWSKPIEFFDTNNSGRFQGGWYDTRYNLLSWAYSCLQLRKFYDEVELYTDELGKRLLIDKLQLPYTKVNVVFQNIEKYDPGLWALGKIYTYSLQKQPFIHVDGDVYIWNQFPEKFKNAELISQNIESNFSFYTHLIKSLKEIDFRFPDYIKENLISGKNNAYNAGIFGGNNIDFFQDYTQEAFRLIEINSSILHKIDLGRFNTFYEQYLFYCLSIKNKVSVECYTDLTEPADLDEKLKSLKGFKSAPLDDVELIHFYGEDRKKDIKVCKALENRMINEHPYYAKKILGKINKKQLSLIK